MMDYAAFEKAMDEDKVYIDLDFEDICLASGIDRDALDKLIFREIGLSGQELVDFYRAKFC